MREVIAKHVENDKETYNEAILGRPNVEYCIWIQEIDSWGGAIEVSILSSFFGVEIDVVDIQNAIIIRFGEDKNYGMRVFLLFDGIHYDPLYLESVSVSFFFCSLNIYLKFCFFRAEHLEHYSPVKRKTFTSKLSNWHKKLNHLDSLQMLTNLSLNAISVMFYFLDKYKHNRMLKQLVIQTLGKFNKHF